MRIVITSNGSSEIRSLSIPRARKNKSTMNSPKRKKKAAEIPRTPSSEKVIPSNLKSVKVASKKLNLPPMMQDKYSETQPNNNYLLEDQEQSSLLPDVLMSIEKSMDQSQGSSSKLPIIRQSYPIKYIISPKSLKKLESDIKERKHKLLIKSKLIVNNHYRTEVKKDPAKIFELNSNKEIKTQNRNLIEYLNTDSSISNEYLTKLAKYDEERLSKLNKICQKAFYYREQEGLIKSIVKQKLKGELNSESEYYKNKLKEMKSDLDKYNKIIEVDYPKYDKRDRYTFQYREAEQNWEKYNTQRFYKKSSPPQTKFVYS